MGEMPSPAWRGPLRDVGTLCFPLRGRLLQPDSAADRRPFGSDSRREPGPGSPVRPGCQRLSGPIARRVAALPEFAARWAALPGRADFAGGLGIDYRVEFGGGHVSLPGIRPGPA